MINIDNKYSIGDIVFIQTDTEQLRRVVTSIRVTKMDLIYEVQAGTIVSNHYDFELSYERDILISA